MYITYIYMYLIIYYNTYIYIYLFIIHIFPVSVYVVRYRKCYPSVRHIGILFTRMELEKSTEARGSL